MSGSESAIYVSDEDVSGGLDVSVSASPSQPDISRDGACTTSEGRGIAGRPPPSAHHRRHRNRNQEDLLLVSRPDRYTDASSRLNTQPSQASIPVVPRR
jgi:hypothetical protein